MSTFLQSFSGQLGGKLGGKGGEYEGILCRCETGMNACIGAGMLDEAHAVLQEMRAAGMRPDVRAFNVLLKGDARVGRVANLSALLEEMRHAQASPPSCHVRTM